MNSQSTAGSTWLRRLCLVGIGLLYVASVPWYREAGAVPALWFGLPDWVTVSVGCYVAVAILNSIAWLNTDVPDHLPGDCPGDDSAGRGQAATNSAPRPSTEREAN